MDMEEIQYYETPRQFGERLKAIALERLANGEVVWGQPCYDGSLNKTADDVRRMIDAARRYAVEVASGRNRGN